MLFILDLTWKRHVRTLVGSLTFSVFQVGAGPQVWPDWAQRQGQEHAPEVVCFKADQGFAEASQRSLRGARNPLAVMNEGLKPVDMVRTVA